MQKEFIPYEQALALKELGFDEPCLGVFYNPNDLQSQGFGHYRGENTNAPLYQQAFRWFREKYSIHAWIINAEDNHNVFKPFFRGVNIHDQHLVDFYKTYEEAELACLKKLIEIVKN
jgi:hypothetical protein